MNSAGGQKAAGTKKKVWRTRERLRAAAAAAAAAPNVTHLAGLLLRVAWYGEQRLGG